MSNFIDVIKKLKEGVLKLKNNNAFSIIDFSQFNNEKSLLFRIHECPHWIDLLSNKITSILGVSVPVTDELSRRLLEKGSISIKVCFPKMEKDGKSIYLDVSTYMYYEKVVYKYTYVTEGFKFGQQNLDYYILCKNVNALLTNKPLTRKNQISGFMQRLNSLSPNFNKSNNDEYE